MIEKTRITGLVLAGGRGSRMGGIDKGLENFHGQPLALHAAERLKGQVGDVWINANRHLDAYEALGFPVVTDALADHQGPLAGVSAGLHACKTPYLVTVPCDSPFFPVHLVSRLGVALMDHDAQIAMAVADHRPQPTFMLMRADVLESLQRFLDEGGRKIGAWTARLRCTRIDFGDADPHFLNINYRDDLDRARGLMPSALG